MKLYQPILSTLELGRGLEEEENAFMHTPSVGVVWDSGRVPGCW